MNHEDLCPLCQAKAVLEETYWKQKGQCKADLHSNETAFERRKRLASKKEFLDIIQKENI